MNCPHNSRWPSIDDGETERCRDCWTSVPLPAPFSTGEPRLIMAAGLLGLVLILGAAGAILGALALAGVFG